MGAFNFPIQLAVLFVAQSFVGSAQFTNPIFIPDTLSGTNITLDLDESTVQFLAGDPTSTYGFNGDYLGPTLLLNKGDFVSFNVTNNLADSTTVHWHGLHVDAADDGGPHTAISQGATWTPDFTILDEASTYWYHPHLHHKTAEQVYWGAAGMLIVRETGGVHDLLPHTYGVDDFPLIIQDKSFDPTTNQFIYTQMADTMMVNGTMNGFLEVPAQMVRFRLLNASNQRVYNFGLPPGLPVFQIGSDGGLLEQPINVPRLQLAPGERMEIVIDFGPSQGDNITMLSFSSDLDDGVSGGPNGPGGGLGNPLDGVDFEVMQFQVIAPTANPVTTLPATLVAHNIPLESNANRYREKVFTVDSTGFPFYINGSLMDMMVINDTVKLDDIEVWTIINNTDESHPWHIHDIQFYVLDINGNPPPPPLAGRKDVILANAGDTIRYITQFTTFTNDSVPYMFHCHNLFHEDAGMMGQFVVTETGTLNTHSISEIASLNVFPNPTKGLFQIEASEELEYLEVYSTDGRLIMEQNLQRLNESTVDLQSQFKGVYLVRVYATNGATALLRIIKSE